MPKKKTFTPDMPETFDIQKRVIFSAGVHNGDLYTEEDLQKMEDAFYACKGKLRPPLKLGHSEDQSLWERDGLPAIGWIDNVKKVGKDLVADFIKVPKVIYELLKAGAYRTTSAEIYWNAVVEGKKYPYALKAVALLGADIPAVKSVSDILALYADGVVAYSQLDECEVRTYDGEDTKKEDNKMPDNNEQKDIKIEDTKVETPPTPAPQPDLNAVVTELKTIVASLSEKKAANEKRIAELSEKLAAAEKNYTDAKATIEANDKAKKFSEIEAKIDGLIAEKKIIPAQKAKIMHLFTEIPSTKTYKDGDKEVSLEDLVFSIFSQNTPIALNTTENTSAGEKQEAADDVAAINKISQTKGLSYKEAYKVWAKEQKTRGLA